MGEKCNWPCWKIMGCDPAQKCPAKSEPEKPCWEIAGALNDYRSVMNICTDCIVYMLKAENSVLDEQERKTILDHKTSCALAA